MALLLLWRAQATYHGSVVDYLVVNGGGSANGYYGGGGGGGGFRVSNSTGMLVLNFL